MFNCEYPPAQAKHGAPQRFQFVGFAVGHFFLQSFFDCPANHIALVSVTNKPKPQYFTFERLRSIKTDRVTAESLTGVSPLIEAFKKFSGQIPSGGGIGIGGNPATTESPLDDIPDSVMRNCV